MIGFLLSVCYVCFFYYYTPAKEKISVWGKVGAAVAFACSIVAYSMVIKFACFAHDRSHSSFVL
jgi:solute carrier family 50 (sugar transporter)